MKKINLFIISIIFTILFMPDNVLAAESLGTCVYELDRTGLEEKLFIGDFDKLSLSITVNDDGTIGANTISTQNGDDVWSSDTRKAGFLGDSRLQLMYSISDKDFYNAYMEKNNCPTIEMAYRDSMYLEVKLGSGNYTEGTPYNTFDNVQSTGGTSSNKPSEIITYCKEKKFNVSGYDGDLYLTTTETNGIKEYSLKTSDGKSFANTFDQIITLDTFRFYINPDSYNTYWSDGCQDAPLYVAVPDITGNTRVIQHTQDSTVENYEPPLLNGGATDENWNDPDNPIECEDIFDTSDEGSVGWILMTILNYVRVIGPIAVVLLSALDFIKAIMSSDEKAMKQAQSKLIIRLVAALALFLIPTLVQLLLDFINAKNCADMLILLVNL